MDIKLKGRHNVQARHGKKYLSTMRKLLRHVHLISRTIFEQIKYGT